MSILFFKPIPRYAVWGNHLVKKYFGYKDFSDGIGQSWSFSAQEDNSTICITPPYNGMTLSELWNNHKELFGEYSGKFPLLISLVAPEDDLSIQIHPNEEYARNLGYSFGKNEAWYFIKCDKNSSIVYGHQAKNEEDLNHYIEEDKWEQLVKKVNVKNDDFVYIPSGTLHALKKGSIVYEVQQSTDVTFRFYDYHRKDSKGNERELHLRQAIECLSFNNEHKLLKEQRIIKKFRYGIETQFISNSSFTIKKLDVEGEIDRFYSEFQLATVIKGMGKINQIPIKIGDNFLITQKSEIIIDGKMVIMLTSV